MATSPATKGPPSSFLTLPLTRTTLSPWQKVTRFASKVGLTHMKAPFHFAMRQFLIVNHWPPMNGLTDLQKHGGWRFDMRDGPYDVR